MTQADEFGVYEPPGSPPSQPLFTRNRLIAGAIALALIAWIGGSGCARADVERKAAAAISPSWDTRSGSAAPA